MKYITFLCNSDGNFQNFTLYMWKEHWMYKVIQFDVWWQWKTILMNSHTTVTKYRKRFSDCRRNVFLCFQFLKLNSQDIETYLVKRPIFWILVLVLLILNPTFSAQTLGLASITLNDKKVQAKLDRLKILIRFYFSTLFQIVNHWWLASANFWVYYAEEKTRGRLLSRNFLELYN